MKSTSASTPAQAPRSSTRSARSGRRTRSPKSYDHSLTHASAYLDGKFVGYVNVAWDGGGHAFLVDPTVHPDYRHRGIGTKLVRAVIGHLAGRGLDWLHVDYRPELEDF